jgi:hypothetical protein
VTKYKINRDQSKKSSTLSKLEVDGFKNFSHLKLITIKTPNALKNHYINTNDFFLGLLLVVIIAYLLSMIDY